MAAVSGPAATAPLAAKESEAAAPAAVVDVAVAPSAAPSTVPAEVASVYTDNTFRELGVRIEHAAGAKAAVRLLKASYLIELYRGGGRLVRRQDLPESAFYTGVLDDRGFRLFAISYPWLTTSHPDPDGFHLRTIGALLAAYCAYVKSNGSDDVVFLDFCSLDQSPRSDEEGGRFKRGLGAINLIYAHQISYVLCLTVVPQGTDRGYDARGWCFFERLVAGALKQSQKLLDVGKLRVAPDAVTDFYAQVDRVCDVSRRPPLTPAAFEAELEKRQFTNGKSDHRLVAGLYAQFVQEALGAATRLIYWELGWGDEQAEELAAVLPLCECLRELNLRGNGIGDRGAAALARSLPAGLEVLDLNSNDALGDEGVAALAARLPDSVRAFNVQAHTRQPPLLCPVANARTVEAVGTVRRFYAGDEATRRAIVAEVADAREAAEWEAASGPAEVVVDGVCCARRIGCTGGQYGFGKHNLGGAWHLSQDEPLIDGAPHYEHLIPAQSTGQAGGAVAHLYRVQSSIGNVRRWVVGPTPGAEGGWAMAQSDAEQPADAGLSWKVFYEQAFAVDGKFRFGGEDVGPGEG